MPGSALHVPCAGNVPFVLTRSVGQPQPHGQGGSRGAGTGLRSSDDDELLLEDDDDKELLLEDDDGDDDELLLEDDDGKELLLEDDDGDDDELLELLSDDDDELLLERDELLDEELLLEEDEAMTLSPDQGSRTAPSGTDVRVRHIPCRTNNIALALIPVKIFAYFLKLFLGLVRRGSHHDHRHVDIVADGELILLAVGVGILPAGRAGVRLQGRQGHGVELEGQ